MGRLGFYYNAARCTGCRACQMACKEKNKLAVGEFCRRVDAVESEGKWQHFSLACNHCEDAACVAVCPTGAMYKAEDGTVQHRDDLCIGCARCVHICPYGAPFIDKYTGYSVKCDACTQRRNNGEIPACVEACPMRALNFGDLDELSRVDDLCGATLPFLPAEEQTLPNLAVRGARSGERRVCLKETQTDLDDSPIEIEARILILGSGVAAASAAKEIRKYTKSASVTMVSREERLPYARPMLSKGLTGSFAMDCYPILEERWFAENAVTYLGGAEISGLDPENHEVVLSDGRKLSYDKCIYALGADCFAPPIPGREKGRVFTLRYDRDLAAIREAMLRAKSAVIIGGGITGLELAWELKKSGLDVTVLDVLERLMDRFLDERSALLLRDAVEAAGVWVKTGVQIKAIEGESCAEQVVLSDGTTIPADIVVLSTGYRPNIAIAQSAGLSVGRAVTVSECMETSDRDIYACGDCVDRSTATWLQSIQQGAIAAANALGANRSFAAEAEPVMVHTANTSVLMVGDMGKQAGETYSFLYGCAVAPKNRFYINPRKKSHQTTHLSLCFRDGHLSGITLLGSIELMLTAQEAVNEKWDTETAKHEFEKRGVVFCEE